LTDNRVNCGVQLSLAADGAGYSRLTGLTGRDTRPVRGSRLEVGLADPKSANIVGTDGRQPLAMACLAEFAVSLMRCACSIEVQRGMA